MIHLGLAPAEKAAEVSRYCAEHSIRKVFLLGPAKFRFDCAFPEHEHVDWPDLIRYVYYYRLLQEIDGAALVVINECLRTQNRHDLTYNCVRLYLQQTPHRLVFQTFPLIDTAEDFMVLFDFDTQSRWKRSPFDRELVRREAEVRGTVPDVTLEAVDVPVSDKTREAYAKEKRQLIDGLGLGDPHAIPRNLYLLGGKSKLGCVDPQRAYVGRNNRFKLPNLATYKEPAYPAAPYGVFEFPHNFIDFSDFLALSGQRRLDVLRADLKVDAWYFDRYSAWAQRIRDVAAVLR